MVEVPHAAGLENAAQRWQDADIRNLLAESALAIGAGSPTDAGLPFTRTTTVASPIHQMARSATSRPADQGFPAAPSLKGGGAAATLKNTSVMEFTGGDYIGPHR